MALILWSGGCDSTLVLHNLLRQQKDGTLKDDKDGVCTLSIVHPQIGAVSQQAAARKVLAAKFEARGFRFSSGVVRIEHDKDDRVPANQVGLVQPQIWLTTAASYLQSEEDLYVGWIRGDDAWHYAHTLRAAFDALQAVGDKKGKLVTPLDCMRKQDVLRELKELKLLDDCWHCEGVADDKNEPCDACPSCDVHKTALWQMKNLRGGRFGDVKTMPAKEVGEA